MKTSYPNLRQFVDRRAVAAAVLGVLAVVGAVSTPQLLGLHIGRAISRLSDASPFWLWAAGAAFALALLGEGQVWSAGRMRASDPPPQPITLDLRVPRGRTLFLDLVKHSDAIVENFRPGTLERWDLSYDTLKTANQDVVLVRVSGYGQDEDRRRSRAAGFDHHLTKPADPGAIEKLLASLRPPKA